MADDDAERFEALYRQHFRGVLGYALARLEPERAKDAAAETFLVAWRRLGEVPAEPAGWLFGVARKVVAQQLRADSRRDALVMRLAAPAYRESRQPADPADEVAQRESALAALALLGERDREILTLLAWHGLTGDQAAEALGLTRLSFAVRLHRARRRLGADTQLGRDGRLRQHQDDLDRREDLPAGPDGDYDGDRQNPQLGNISLGQ